MVRFVDSYRVLSRELANLVSILPPVKMRTTSYYFPDSDQFELVRRKGVFPYEYVSSIVALDEEVFPPAEAFRDNLRKQNIAVEDYTDAHCFWAEFGSATLEDYAIRYSKTVVLLLVDVFERFRDVSGTPQTRSGPPDHSFILRLGRYVVKN